MNWLASATCRTFSDQSYLGAMSVQNVVCRLHVALSYASVRVCCTISMPLIPEGGVGRARCQIDPRTMVSVASMLRVVRLLQEAVATRANRGVAEL